MNLGELKDLVAVYLDDLSFGYHTETQVTRYLNNAQKEAQKLLIQAGQNFYLQCKQTSLVAESCQYALPSDFAKVNRLEIVVSGTAPNEDTATLYPITLNQQDMINRKLGTPEAYCLVKDAVKLFPMPDDSNDGRVLRLDYTYRVSDMASNGDEPDIPEAYHELLACLAARDGFIRDDRNTQTLDDKIAGYISQMKQDASDRIQQTGRMVVLTQDQGTGYLY